MNFHGSRLQNFDGIHNRKPIIAQRFFVAVWNGGGYLQGIRTEIAQLSASLGIAIMVVGNDGPLFCLQMDSGINLFQIDHRKTESPDIWLIKVMECIDELIQRIRLVTP